jgi:hypothetical protein
MWGDSKSEERSGYGGDNNAEGDIIPSKHSMGWAGSW